MKCKIVDIKTTAVVHLNKNFTEVLSCVQIYSIYSEWPLPMPENSDSHNFTDNQTITAKCQNLSDLWILCKKVMLLNYMTCSSAWLVLKYVFE